MHTYKDLIVWQKGVELSILMYEITEQFPSHEKFGLMSQMRRAAVSIPSNIAEGKLRGSSKELRQFLYTAFVSGGELKTQISIAKQLDQTKDLDFSRADTLLEEIMKILNKMLTNLKPNT